MDDPERRFLVGVWRALSREQEGASTLAVHKVAAEQGVSDWQLLDWLRGWARAGWWVRDGGRLSLMSAGRFTEAGAKEVGYQAAAIVRDGGATGFLPPPPPAREPQA